MRRIIDLRARVLLSICGRGRPRSPFSFALATYAQLLTKKIIGKTKQKLRPRVSRPRVSWEPWSH